MTGIKTQLAPIKREPPIACARIPIRTKETAVVGIKHDINGAD
jgi:hypothetical protein